MNNLFSAVSTSERRLESDSTAAAASDASASAQVAAAAAHIAGDKSAEERLAPTASVAAVEERRARRVPASGRHTSASASDRPARRAHVGLGYVLLGAVLVVALLMPAASAVPARRIQRRARSAAAAAAAPSRALSSSSSSSSNIPQLRLFGRCRQSRNGILEWATFCLACGLEAGTIVVYDECCEPEKYADMIQFCREYTPVQYHPHESQFRSAPPPPPTS